MSLMASTGNVRSQSQATPSVVVDGAPELKQREPHSNRRKVHIDFENFYGIESTRVDRTFELTLSDTPYLPKVGLLPPFNLR